MMSKRLCALVHQIGKATVEAENAKKRALLRMDLSDLEYAKWFLSEKVVKGRLLPPYFMNDFVLFRIAYDWPGSAKWVLDADDLRLSSFALSSDLALDLVAFSEEQMSDGYRDAAWFLKVAVVWHASNAVEMPQPLYSYLERTLFLPKSPRQGRKRSDGIDRDRTIRNVVAGLNARGCAIEKSYEIVAETLNMTPHAVRKLIERTPRTEREERLWRHIQIRWAGFDPITMERLASASDRNAEISFW